MSTRATLKSYFLTGLKPTAGQFAALIDSFFKKDEDTLYIGDISGLGAAIAGKASAATVAAIIADSLIDGSAGPLSKAYLNANYPTALKGQYVLVAGASLKYLKLDASGNWDEQPYNPVV